MKLLLHICCAPCSIKCTEALRAEGIEPTGYWYGPNIHPYTEYSNRKNALIKYAEEIGLKLILKDEYGLKDFIRLMSPSFTERCGKCYELRMYETARYAAENGYDAFTATLFISPFQNHELLKETCQKASEKYGVEFLYRDFRPYYRDGQAAARENGMYMQKYCGCIFSEEERFAKK